MSSRPSSSIKIPQTQLQHTNYSVYNPNKYPMPKSPTSAYSNKNQQINSQINRFMPRISEVPEPSVTQSNLYVLRENHNSSKKSLEPRDKRNIKLLSPSSIKPSEQNFGDEPVSPCDLYPAQFDAEVRSMKENTIYKSKLSNNQQYTTEEMYFGLFAAKNKCKQLSTSASASNIQAAHSINKTDVSNHIQLQNNRKNSKETHLNAEDIRNKNQQLNNMRKQYNRLRKYMQQLEKQNQNLKKNNQQLIKTNNRLKQKVHGRNRSSFNKSQLDIVSNVQQKIRNTIMNVKTQTKANSQENKVKKMDSIHSINSEEDSTYNLLVRAQEEIITRDSIIKDLEKRLHQMSIIEPKQSTCSKCNLKLETQDILQENKILELKNMVERSNSQSNLLKTKIQYLHNQITTLVTTINSLTIMCQQQKAQLLEKEMEIDLEIRHTKTVLSDWKRGIQTKETSRNENDQYSENFHTEQTKETDKIWFKKDDQSSSDYINNLQSHRSSEIGREKRYEPKFFDQHTYSKTTSGYTFQNLPTFHVSSKDRDKNNVQYTFRHTSPYNYS